MSSAIILAMTLFVFQGDYQKGLLGKLTNPTRLKSSVLISGETLNLFVTGLDRLGKDELVFFGQKDKLIKTYDLKSGRLSIFARDGEGPGEFREGFIFGSVVGETVVVQEWASRQSKAISKNGTSWLVFETRWPIRSLVSVAGKYVVGMVSNPGSTYWDGDYVEKKLAADSNILFELGEEGRPWELHGTFFTEDFADDFDFDSTIGIKTNLYPIRDSSHFYRVPFYTSSVLQVMDISGQVVREIPIPHPFASDIPKNVAIRLRLYKENPQDFIRDASVDRFGKLHVVLSNIRETEEDYSRRLGVVMDEHGKIEKGFLLDRPIRRFVVSEDGTRYFGIDEEEDALLEFHIPKGP